MNDPQQPAANDTPALTLLVRLRGGEKLLPAALDFRGAALRGADLSGLNLSGADFSEADLSQSNLSDTKLFKAKLAGANLLKAVMNNAELTGASLSHANLENVRAHNCGFGMADFAGARLFNADLTGSTLTKGSLAAADLRCAVLDHARLREVDFTGADLTGASLRHADLAKSTVTEATFDNADLREVRLRQVAGFEKASWIGVDIRDINFAGAYRLRRFVVDQNYLKEFREINRFCQIVYRIWWLTSDCGRSLSRWCVWTLAITSLFAWLYTLGGVDFGRHPDWIAPFYFSVVTLCTLGYGDMVPVTPPMRLLAIIEVFAGYVMLGGLLSIFTNKMARRGE